MAGLQCTKEGLLLRNHLVGLVPDSTVAAARDLALLLHYRFQVLHLNLFPNILGFGSNKVFVQKKKKRVVEFSLKIS